jgi:YfiH family protein
MLTAPNLSRFPWLTHGFGGRDTVYPTGITTLRQIHSGIVLEATEPGVDRFADGDGLITNQPGVLVGVRTADCVPILIVDARTHSVAAVHAGWRGTAAEIVRVAVEQMGAFYNSNPNDLHAAIGPAIGQCCYEVGPDVAHQFCTTESRIDLSAINAQQLTNAGVNDVWQSHQCTFCEAEKYFSYRREKEAAGRMISFAGCLRP